MDLSLTALKHELTQLKESHRAGHLSDTAFDEARRALERRIVEAVLREDAPASAPVASATPSATPTTASIAAPGASSSTNLWIALVAVVLAISGAAYWWKGAPRPVAAVAPVAAPMAVAPGVEGAPHDTGNEQIAAMVDRLALKLKDKPQDAEGWSMLARSYAVLGRHAEAATAFERAIALRPNDASLTAGYADSVAKAGAVAVATGVSSTNTAAPSAQPAAAHATVSGTVTLAPALAKQASPEDTLFVFARAAQGERIPLAVLRRQVKDLPLQFTLDDSMGMSPQNKLSGATQVVVSARISKSGQAMPQAGDIAGQAPPVNVGASGISIELRELVK